MGLFTQPLTIWAPRPTVTPREVSSQTRPPIRSLASSTTTWNQSKLKCLKRKSCKSTAGIKGQEVGETGTECGQPPGCQSFAVAAQQPGLKPRHQWRQLSSASVIKFALFFRAFTWDVYCCVMMMFTLTELYLSGSSGRFTVSTPVLMRPFLVMKWSTRSISCTQRTRTSPRTMMCRAHFWGVSTSYRYIEKWSIVCCLIIPFYIGCGFYKYINIEIFLYFMWNI